jgi:hypothetical protein
MSGKNHLSATDVPLIPMDDFKRLSRKSFGYD